MIYKTIILGGGPAGCAAGVYAARKGLKTLVLTDTFGGQSIVSPEIFNWIGTQSISGDDLAKSLESHLRAYNEVIDIESGHYITTVSKTDDVFTITTKQGSQEKTYQSKTVLYTLGSKRRTLNIPGADTFEHRGLTYCASCDGPIFSGQDVVVVGGGNAGFESALQLLAYCSHVTLLNRSDTFRADEITVASAMKHPNFTVITNAVPTAVSGDKFVQSISYTVNGIETVLPTAGIFVEIGQLPNTDPVKNLTADLLDKTGKIITDPQRGCTTLPGLWAAGDCTNCLYHQNNIAAGDAVRALEDLYIWVQKHC
jgi:NADH-dependent peroxiredoxin subunit F